MLGGFGLTTLVLKPVKTEIVNGPAHSGSLTTDSDIYFNSVAGTTNQYTATLNNLDSGSRCRPGPVHPAPAASTALRSWAASATT